MFLLWWLYTYLTSKKLLQQVLKQLKDKALKRAGLTEENLQEQIEQRNAARKNKQFEISDGIRKNLATKGIALMDEPTGTVWRPCEPEGSEEPWLCDHSDSTSDDVKWTICPSTAVAILCSLAKGAIFWCYRKGFLVNSPTELTFLAVQEQGPLVILGKLNFQFEY